MMRFVFDLVLAFLCLACSAALVYVAAGADHEWQLRMLIAAGVVAVAGLARLGKVL